MQSTTRTVPLPVTNSVSRTSDGPRYLRVTEITGTEGAICHRPWSGVPNSAAKQAAESKRGRHSQSIDPSFPTSAAVCMSPISA